jgi:hypothetical protein
MDGLLDPLVVVLPFDAHDQIEGLVVWLVGWIVDFFLLRLRILLDPHVEVANLGVAVLAGLLGRSAGNRARAFRMDRDGRWVIVFTRHAVADVAGLVRVRLGSGIRCAPPEGAEAYLP